MRRNKSPGRQDRKVLPHVRQILLIPRIQNRKGNKISLIRYNNFSTYSSDSDEEKSSKNRPNEKFEKAAESGSEIATSISNYSNEDDESHDILKIDDIHTEMVAISENEEKTTEPEYEDIKKGTTNAKVANLERNVNVVVSSLKQSEKSTVVIPKGFLLLF